MRHFIIFLFAISLTSCATYRVAKFESNQDIQQKIPNLDLKLVDGNLESFYHARKAGRLCTEKPFKSELHAYGTGFIHDESVGLYTDPGKVINEKRSGFGISIGNGFDGSGSKSQPVLVRIGGVTFDANKHLIFEEAYFGRLKSFQDSLIANSNPIALDINTYNENYFTLYKTIIDSSCPSYAPYVYYNDKSLRIGNRGVENLTVPSLIKDTKELINYEFINNICQAGESRGYAVIKILSGKNSTTKLIVPSALTICTINFLGFPFMIQKKEVQVQVDIYDLNNNMLGSYSATATGKASSAMWYGYSLSNAAVSNSGVPLSRASNSKSISNALKEIKKQIEQDSDRLTNLLTKAI